MQRTRKLTSFESAMLKKHGEKQAAFTDNRGRQVFSQDQIATVFAAERAERAEIAQKQIKSDAEYFTSEEFRQEVIEELMANGANLEQATNRTRDQARCFNEARELGLM